MSRSVSNLIVRNYSDADYEEVINLWTHLHLKGEIHESKRDLHRMSILNPTTFLIGEIDGRVIATVLGTYDGRRGFIAQAGVDLAFQHQGIASQLGKALIARFQAMGVDQIMGFVDQSNLQVLDFYALFGAKPRTDLIPIILSLDRSKKKQ